ncbi:hypothetical protein [uncultured Winogradskyella sp.]|uniref:hypothetical protein n=1 Tax=uncultured Winogradskyella sp. TaxID=395353 RepID=UPI0026261489|nr:hypothetical protein [uncultured Winogradskyella sp.]
MPILHINRISEYENRARKIKIEVNGKLITKIKNGENLELELTPGKHLIQAKIDWCSSNLLEVEMEEQTETNVELKKGEGSAIYRITFGYKEYLKLILID